MKEGERERERERVRERETNRPTANRESTAHSTEHTAPYNTVPQPQNEKETDREKRAGNGRSTIICSAIII